MTKEQFLTLKIKEAAMNIKTLHDVFHMPIGQLEALDEHEIRHLIIKAELLCLWLQGVLRLKTRVGGDQ